MSQELFSRLSLLRDDEILTGSAKLAEAERAAVISALQHICEVEKRRAYVRLGYSSVWEYAIKGLKYSESVAFQRISAIRALKIYPELEEALLNGTLSVSTVSQVQRVLKAERDQALRVYSRSEQLELFKKCENKDAKEVRQILIRFSPLALRVQNERLITDNRTEISFVADPVLFEKIRRVRDLSVARLRTPSSYPELLDLMSEVTLDEIDPMRKPDRKPKSAGADDLTGTRNVSQALRAKIWKDYGGKCGFVVPEIGIRCESTFGLEIEHCRPHALGGSSKDPANLMLLCKKHNQWRAIQAYGLSKMVRYLK